MKQRRILRLLALVGVLALIGAACSNDDGGSSGDSGATGATGGAVDCGWLPPREPEADGSEQKANDTEDLRPAGAAAIVPDDRRRGH